MATTKIIAMKNASPASKMSPVDFYNIQVAPAVFDQAGQVFPEFSFIRNMDSGWTATNSQATKSAFGARAGRVVCNRPGGFLPHGDAPVSWLAYIMGTKQTPKGADFVHAVRELAKRANVDCAPIDRELTDAELKHAGATQRHQELLEAFDALTKRALSAPEGQKAHDYLINKRGVEVGEIPLLPVGYCPSKLVVESELRAQGFTDDEIEDSKITHDVRWNGRLTITQRDALGQIETFIARDLSGEADPAEKYLKLKGAKAKSPLFGLTGDAITAARRSGLLIVEGYVDTAIFQARGFLNVAATGGNFGLLTVDRWKDLKKHGFPSITLATDNDRKPDGTWIGLEKQLQALKNLSNLPQGPTVRVLPPEQLGTAKDPDEFVLSHGLDALRDLVSKAVPWEGYYGQHLLGSVTPEDDQETRQSAITNLAEFAATRSGTQAALAVEDLYKQAAAHTGYTLEAVKECAAAVKERERKEQEERLIKTLVRDFHTELGKPGADPVLLAAKYARQLNECLPVSGTDALPSPFSVERLMTELKQTPVGYSTGLETLDRLNVRLQPKGLSIFCGRTGHGKTTAMVGQLHTGIRRKLSKRILFYSLEEPEDMIFCRLVALQTANNASPSDRWGYAQVRDYLQSPDSHGPSHGWPNPRALQKAIDELRGIETALQIVYAPSWPINQISAHAHKVAQEEGGVGMIFLDYLQRVPSMPGRKSDRRDVEVSAVGRGLKELAVALAVPVVAGAQINREAIPAGFSQKIQKNLKIDPSGRTAISSMQEARPDLHHLREGGSEQEADLVLGLMNYNADFRMDAISEEASTNLYEIGVLKNRYGQVGRWAQLALDGPTGLIRDRTAQEIREDMKEGKD